MYKKNSNQAIFAHVTIGLQLGITMVVFVYGGYRLDLHLEKSPLFLVIGTIFGMILGFYHLFKNLQIADKTNGNPKDGNSENVKRIKWN